MGSEMCIRDSYEIDKVDELDKKYLGDDVGDIKVREVILLGNKIPKVYAKSLIPVDTIEKGFSKLGSLGTKPLGDILFEKDIFNKTDTIYSTFSDEVNIFWGRKTKYTVKNLPFSVMEIFLMIRRPPRSTHCISSAASDVYKRQNFVYPFKTIT